MKKTLGTLLTPPFLLMWGLILLVFHLLQVLAWSTLGAAAHRWVVAGLNGSLLANLWLLGTHIRSDVVVPPQGRPLIVVANHQNKYDIPGLSWYLRHHRPRFVAKIELARGIPSISYNLRRSGAALIDRSDARQSLREIGRLGRLTAEDHGAAVIFPEGTRSTSGRLAPFAAGGVKTLLKHAPEALLLPVYIHNTWALNRYGRFPMSPGETIGWHVLPAIDPHGMTVDAALALAEQRIREAAQRHAPAA